MTTSQKSSQRHQTSVFSEYENNFNNSISSKQLEVWLQQMAPTSHTSPKFGQDWNLMSTSSRYESDGMTFGARMDTFESANKQNILSKANFVIEPSKSLIKQNHYQSLSQPQNSQKISSSKSYINAMKELQKRAKTLEQDNANMRKSLQIFQQQKRNSLQSSMVESQELKSKKLKYEETQKRIEEIKRQNKKLRDSKNEQSLKVKLMQKSINEQKQKVKTFEQRLEMLSKQNEDLKKQLIESNNMTKLLMMENKQLAIKTETLQNMKEKSTNSILEKYAKALERIEELELAVGELKTKGNSIEEKHKKIIQEKDGKYFTSLETINNLKLEKEQLCIRLENSNCQLDQRTKKVQKLESKLKSLEINFSEQGKQKATLKNIIIQKDEKLAFLGQKYTQVQAKYASVKEKIKAQRKKHFQQIKSLRQKAPQIQDQQYKSESEYSVLSEQIDQNAEKYNTNMSHLVEEKAKQEETPVERYDHTSPGFEITELQQFTTLSKPLSIIINAKNLQPRIKSQEAEPQKIHEKVYESSEEQESFENQEYIKIKKQQNQAQKVVQTKQPSNRKSITIKEPFQQNKTVNQQKSISKEGKEQKSKSKQSVKSANSRKQSLQQSKYLVPCSNYKKGKNQTKVIQNNSTVSSQNRSKSSSMEKKKSSQQKSISMDSKRNSVSIKKSRQGTAQRPNTLIKSSEPTQSRYVNQRPHQAHMYMSAEPIRYQHPQHYYYTNQINAKGIQEDQRFHNDSFLQQPNISIQGKSMICKSESEVKKALNKALLLEYQEEALKLYEEHEKLLAMSENENITTQEKAQILGRTRQVMNMIDHNTEKIFNLKGRAE